MKRCPVGEQEAEPQTLCNPRGVLGRFACGGALLAGLVAHQPVAPVAGRGQVDLELNLRVLIQGQHDPRSQRKVYMALGNAKNIVQRDRVFRVDVSWAW